MRKVKCIILEPDEMLTMKDYREAEMVIRLRRDGTEDERLSEFEVLKSRFTYNGKAKITRES